jgi:hypothetical protein
MRSPEKYWEVNRLITLGWRDRDISRSTGVPTGTIYGWRRGVSRRSPPEPDGPPWRPTDEAAVYSYLLGLYLGDGHVSIPASGTSFLRLFLDAQYQGVIDEAAAAMATVARGARVTRQRKAADRVVVVQCTWRSWPEAFPQHGPGPKHERPIRLRPWQLQVAERFPRSLIRGLIHSDGCRTINRFRTQLPSGRVATYEYARYFFSNRSEDILRIFTDACSRVGVDTTRSNHRNVSISKRPSVAMLDSFVGAKTCAEPSPNLG